MNSFHKPEYLSGLVSIGVVFFLLHVSALAHADAGIDFQSGLEAYEKGDYKAAFKVFKPLAEQGDSDAQFCLGVMYTNGNGVPKDYIQAHMWLNLAAMAGDKKTDELRVFVEKRMTHFDISAAQQLAREWMKKHEE
jgi:TPR repeat protein